MNIYAMKKPKRINSVSVGLTLILVGVGYLGYALLPVVWPLWRVSGIMRTACVRGFRDVRDDEGLVKAMVRDTRRTGLPLSPDNFLFERIPFDDETLANMPVAKRNQSLSRGRACLMRFRYAADYTLPVFGIGYHLPYESQVEYAYEDEKSSKTNPMYELFYNSCTCTSVGD